MKEIDPSELEGTFVAIFNCDGKDIAFDVFGPALAEMDAFLDGVAEFLISLKNQCVSCELP